MKRRLVAVAVLGPVVLTVLAIAHSIAQEAGSGTTAPKTATMAWAP